MSLNRTVLARRVNQRGSKAAKLNAFERKRLQEMRKAQKIQNQIARLLKSMVIRVEKRIDREVKLEQKKAKRLEKELLRKNRLNEASKKRKLKIRKNTLLRCVREEMIFRKRCVQQIRAPRQDETKSKCMWPPRDPDGNLMPLPSMTKDDEGNMKIDWDEENADDLDEETQKERLLQWNRYLWNKLAVQKLPERSKISSCLRFRVFCTS